MTLGTRAIDVDCPTCKKPKGSFCVGDTWCQARINLASKITREDNKARKAKACKT